MALTLIAVVLALVLGHVAPGLVGLRRYGWFIAWLHWLGRVFGGQSVWQGRFGLLIGVGVPVALVGVGQFFLDDQAYGLPAFGYALLALLYTWGPRDLDLDVNLVIAATDPESRRGAAATLFPEGGDPGIERPALVQAGFRCPGHSCTGCGSRTAGPRRRCSEPSRSPSCPTAVRPDRSGRAASIPRS